MVPAKFPRGGGGGILAVYMMGGGGGSNVFFWVENLHAQYFLGSRDLSHIFLGLKKIRIFFGSYIRANFLRLFLRMQNGSYGRGGDLKQSILPSVDQM